MADAFLWASIAVRRANPFLADQMLTIYATLVVAVMTSLYIRRRFWPHLPEPTAAAPPDPLEPAADDHLTWAPLRLIPLDHNAFHAGLPQPTKPDDSEHTIYDFWGRDVFDGTEASDTFLLSDLTMGESVLSGYTTSGHWAFGVVTGYEEGKYFRFDGPNEGSLLWSGLLLLRGPMAEEARERFERQALYSKGDCSGNEPLPAAPMKRTDSGTNYGFSGYPDYEFWKRSGCPLYWKVTADDYGGYPDPLQYPSRIREIRENLLAENYASEAEREAMEQQAGTLAEEFFKAASAEADGNPSRAAELMEQLAAAWEMREEGEIVETAEAPPTAAAAQIDLEAVD